jgi:hypothetical protein
MSRNALAVASVGAGAALNLSLGVDPAGGAGCFIDSVAILAYGGGTWNATNVFLTNILNQSTGSTQNYILMLEGGGPSQHWFWNFLQPLPYSPVLGAGLGIPATPGISWEAQVQVHYGNAARRGGLY